MRTTRTPNASFTTSNRRVGVPAHRFILLLGAARWASTPTLLFAVLLFLPCFALAEVPAPTTQPSTSGELLYTPSVREGDKIGKVYMGREISNVMGHVGADWLERPEREREEAPRKAIGLIGFKPTDVVADIGAGTGYFSFRIAPKVPQGKVLAEDIEQAMLTDIKANAEKAGVKNVQGVLGTVVDPNLPEAGVDVVLMVDSYHEFDHPREMMTAIVKALKPGGRVIDLEYRGEDRSIPILPHHKMTEAQAIKEMSAVGLKHVKTFEDLPRQHLMVFQKPVEGNPETRSSNPRIKSQ